jgi:transcription elongation factor Elf1
MTPKTISHGEIEFACPACGQSSVHSFDRLEADAGFVCAGCGKAVTLGVDQISKAIKAGQRALNATIRGIKKGAVK